jgi:uncharacterized protein involved in type VI secretion and phage assembly
MTISLYETIRGIIQQEIKQLRLCELAIVHEQHPHAADADKDNYSCTVVLRDSAIVLKQVPIATGRLGFAAIPDIGDLVLVQFLGGDINAPIIIGRLYNDEDRPPLSDDGKVILQLPKAASEGEGVFVAAGSVDESSVRINVGGTVVVHLQDDDPAVEINIAGGGGLIKVAQDGTITITSQSGINLKSDADINIEAGGTMHLKGSIINLN